MPMKIRTAEQYREASEEVQRLQVASDDRGSTRLKELTTAMQEYELAHEVDPRCRPARPPGSI